MIKTVLGIILILSTSMGCQLLEDRKVFDYGMYLSLIHI